MEDIIKSEKDFLNLQNSINECICKGESKFVTEGGGEITVNKERKV